MDIVNKLNNEFLKQDFVRTKRQLYLEELEKYKGIASGYAHMENGIAVLSDMRTNISYIYYGGFSKALGINTIIDAENQIDSIWEEKILHQVHPEDLYDKYLQELRFFHFMKHQPKGRRSGYYLANELRMKDAAGNYLPVLHRLFYVSSPLDNSICLLYTSPSPRDCS